MRKESFLLVVFALVSGLQAEAGVVKKSLPNGLRVLVKEDHTSPVVAVNMWFDVGSVNETDEMTGLAHFQEHMVFKGTEKYGVGEIARLVKAAGGNLNAGTSYSYTMYYVVLPSRSFELGLAVQAEAMMRSTFDSGEFKKERIVVIDEARMYDDSPDAFVYYRTLELGFEHHSYRRPIAGYEKVVRKIKRDQLLDFYHSYYRPSNAVLVVVGDVAADKALQVVEKIYGPWQDRKAPVHEPPPEPPQRSLRFKEYRGSIDHAYIGVGFHIPSIRHGDYPAIEVLSQLLASGKSSRLYRVVQEEKRLVTTSSSQVLAEKWPGFFQVYASMPPGKWERARDAIFDELGRFQREPCAEEELLKARRQLQKSIYSELETMEGQAANLGYYELLGDYRLADAYREAIRRVTPEMVMEVARKYFRLDNCSIVAYLPEKFDGPGRSQEEVEKALAGKLSPVGSLPEAAFSLEAQKKEAMELPVAKEAETGKRAGEEQRPRMFRLDNGLRVIVKSRDRLPLITMLTMVQGGTRMEPEGRSGLAILTMRSIIKGTRSYDAEAIARIFEEHGGSIEPMSSFDVSGVYTSILSDNIDAVLPVYREILREPVFANEEVEKEKSKLLEELAGRHDNPVTYSIDTLFSDVFGDHPYSHPFLGDEKELANLTSRDCSEWLKSVLVPKNTVLVFIGDITEEKARLAAESLFGDSNDIAPPEPTAPPPTSIARTGEHVLRRKNLNQSMALVGFIAPPMMTQEALGLEVLNGVLTGLGGRLFVELRDKRSLGYMAGSAFVPLKDSSIFLGYANPTAEGVDEAIQVITEELDRVVHEEITEEELERSREWLIGTQTMRLQRNIAQAIAYGTYEVLGYGFQVVDELPGRMRTITRDDVRKAASNVFDSEEAVFLKLLPETSDDQHR